MYYGTKKISEVKDVKENGIDYVLILFEPEKDENGNDLPVPPELTSREILEHVQTEELSDADKMWEKRVDYISDDITRVLLKHNVYDIELNVIQNFVKGKFDQSFEEAVEKLLDEPKQRRSLALYNRIIKG